MESNDAAPSSPALWLLLVHQLPAKPAYLRVKVWRRLQALGAVTVKNSVYVLPAGERTQEDFEWTLKEVVEGGGEGMICEARLVDGLSDEEIQALFNQARESDYDAIAKSARELEATLTGDANAVSRAEAKTRLAKLKAEAARVGSRLLEIGTLGDRCVPPGVGIRSADDVEECGGVGDRPAEGPLGGHALPPGHGRGHPAPAGLEPDQPTTRRRDPD